MENTPEEGTRRRSSWPDQQSMTRSSGSEPTNRKYISDKFKAKEITASFKNIKSKELPIEENKKEDKTIEEMVGSLTPSSNDEFYALWKKANRLESAGEQSDKKFKTEFDKWIAKPENKLDFSTAAISKIKTIVTSAINESPKFKWAVKEYGFPIIAIKTESAERESLVKRDGENGDSEKSDNPVGLISDPFLGCVSFLPSAIDSLYGSADSLESNSRTSTPKLGDPIVDPTINGQIRHEWSHYLITNSLNDSERNDRGNSLKDKNKAELLRIAEKYSSDSTLMAMLDREFSETKNTPRMITRYAHSNMFEMFAEGMSAYMHPDTTLERFVMNAVLREDIESALGASGSNKPWNKEI